MHAAHEACGVPARDAPSPSDKRTRRALRQDGKKWAGSGYTFDYQNEKDSPRDWSARRVHAHP